jgi:hypothetical protein
MKSKYVYYLMLGLIGLLVVGLVGSAYGVNALLTSQSKQLLHNRLQISVLAAEQTQLVKAKNDIKKYQDLATIAKSVVPQDKDQAQTVRQIVDIAAANHITLSSITFPASTLGTTTGNATQRNLSQLAPVVGIPGVYNLQLTVQSDTAAPIPYSQFIGFLAALEHNRRTALVSSITLQPDAKDRSKLSFTLTLQEYIKP